MSQLVERLRAAFRDPNPIVRKELLVLIRTPAYVRLLVAAMLSVGVAVLSVALVQTDNPYAATAETGRVLFQIYFALTFLFVAVVGATIGAMTLTQEREGRTLDALLLSALGPRRIVLGKLLAVALAMAFVPVATLPMLGVALLFGGVSVGHVLVAWAYVLALGAVGIAFGVALSARAPTTRRALLAAVPAVGAGALAIGGLLTALGVNLRRSRALTFDGPFFFADAYFALPVDGRYLWGLVALPLYVIGGSLWLAYAAATSGLTDPSDDRGQPLKRWAIWAFGLGVALLAGAARAFALSRSDLRVLVLAGQVAAALVGIALVSTFAGEPLARTPRMLRHPPPPLAAALYPPGLAPSLSFVTALVAATLLALPVAVFSASDQVPPQALLAVGAWGAAYVAALAALVGWLAAWRRRPEAARVGLSLALLLTCVLVGLAALLLDLLPARARDGNLLVASWPVWVVAAAAEPPSERALELTLTAAGLYGALAAALGAALRRARRAALAADRALYGASPPSPPGA